MIIRFIQNQIIDSIQPGRVTGLFGARRTGKTVLLQQVASHLEGSRVLIVNGDDLDTAEILGSRRLGTLRAFTAGYTHLFVDEAQMIPDIGLSLKLIVDSIPGLAVFVTGSSALDLRGQLGEPLTGRIRYFTLHPLAEMELHHDYLTARQNLESRLLFGSYPQVITAESESEIVEVLLSIRDGYLLKDVLAIDRLKDSLFILNLLRLLAHQIGNDVSHSELGNALGVSKNTVARYLDVLEKCYVIFSVQALSRNLRNEIGKTRRYYFWDNGIRNAVISNFNRLVLRDDTGKLWENYCMAERRKRNDYLQEQVNYYFWRTYDGKEIDLVEERSGRLQAYEFKWSASKVKTPSGFLGAYPGSGFEVIHRENYLQEFIGRRTSDGRRQTAD